MVTVAGFWVPAGKSLLLLYWAAGASNTAGLYVVLAAIVVVVLFVFFGIRQHRAYRKRLLLRGQVLDGGSGAIRHGRLFGRFGGREAELFNSGGGKRGPVYFKAQLACSSPLKFGIFPRATVSLGRPKNAFESGDAALDKEFGFISEDAGRFMAWFQRPENKQQIAGMLHHDSHRCEIALSKGQLVWGVRGGLASERNLPPAETAGEQGRYTSLRADSSTSEDWERAQVRQILENLRQLAIALENAA